MSSVPGDESLPVVPSPVRRRLRAALASGTAVLLLLLLLAACGGSSSARIPPPPRTPVASSETPSPSLAPEVVPSESPSASPTPVATAAEIIKVAELTFPRSTESPGQVAYVDCSRGGGSYSRCPFTRRLLARLEAIHVPPCRCQSFFPQRRISTVITPTGGIAHVNFGVARIDLILVRSDGHLLVDDERCGGRGASSSIYANAGPC